MACSCISGWFVNKSSLAEEFVLLMCHIWHSAGVLCLSTLVALENVNGTLWCAVYTCYTTLLFWWYVGTCFVISYLSIFPNPYPFVTHMVMPMSLSPYCNYHYQLCFSALWYHWGWIPCLLVYDLRLNILLCSLLVVQLQCNNWRNALRKTY